MDIVVFTSGWTWLPAGLALLFGFSNGFRDASTIVATVVSTRALSAPAAFAICATFEFIGAAFIGSRVITTMSSAILSGSAAAPGEATRVLAAALAAAFAWGLLSWWRAWPTSNSQALVGGLAGASWMTWGGGGFVDPKKLTIFIVLILSPTFGFLAAALLTSVLRRTGEWMTVSARGPMRALHAVTCAAVSTLHGSNDGQIVAAILVCAAGAAAGHAEPGAVPPALRVAAGLVIASGVAFGGQRLLRKIGLKFFRIRDVQGLGAQASAAATLATCLAAGFPASTTQVISGAIVGAGVAKNARSVRWNAVRDIALSWVVTVPACAAMAAALSTIRWGGR